MEESLKKIIGMMVCVILIPLFVSCLPSSEMSLEPDTVDFEITIQPNYQEFPTLEKTSFYEEVNWKVGDQLSLSNPGLRVPEFQSISDVDQDGLLDDLEYYIAMTYSPLLIFDENEQEDVAFTVIPLYQVSPVTHWSGQSGAMLVFTFLYDNDNGADFDRDWSDWVTDPWNAACGAAADPFDQFFGKHCGDTEVVYFFVGQWDNWQTTRLLSIYWKRHYDNIYETSENVVGYDNFSGTSTMTHPIIYVSEDKHGMYPTHEFCEDYQTDVLWEKANIPCWPKMEDCSDGVSLQISNLSPQWNVGEAINKDTKNRGALNGSQYQV